jgi:uncharacterized protein (DUF983 family)
MKTTFRVYLPKPPPRPPPPPDDDGSFALLRGIPPGKPVWRSLVWRALALRCPVCGQGRPFSSWLGLRERCGVCAYRYERESGYWLGAMTLNYGLVGGLCLVLLVALPLWTWPAWAQVAFWVLAASAAVVALFPYSRLLWIVFDFLFLGPPKPEDFPDGEGGPGPDSRDVT